MKMPWGKYQDMAVVDLPDNYLHWLVGEGFIQDTPDEVRLWVALTREHGRRKQRYMARQRDLRAVVQKEAR